MDSTRRQAFVSDNFENMVGSDAAPFMKRLSAMVGKTITGLDVALTKRGVSVGWSFDGQALSIHVYTDGGAEPDPFVHASIDDAAFEAGGYGQAGPWCAGAVRFGSTEALREAGWIEESSNPVLLGSLEGVWFDSHEVRVSFSQASIMLRAGMEDFIKPRKPTASYWRPPFSGADNSSPPSSR